MSTRQQAESQETIRGGGASRVAAVAGCALLACAFAAGMAGCGNKTQVSVSAEGVTISDESGTQTYELRASGTTDEARTVTVTGIDSVQVVPDTAEVTVGVSLQEDTADKAQSEAAQVVDDVTAALAALGVDEQDIATANVYLYPRYDYSSSVEKVVGYEMNVSLSVKNLAIDEVGAVIAAATGAGATSVGGISYTCSDYDAQYRQALEKALAVAEGKAQSIAAANGDALGERLSVSEGYDGQVYRNAESKMYDGAAAEAAVGAEGSLAVDPGTIEVSATVTVEYSVAAQG